MNKIIECVPNFSEGRNMAVIDKITAEIEKIPQVLLLDVDPGKDTNRTVVTFAGSPEAVLEAAFQAIKKAAELIDMSAHHGAHARMGATDVCPLVPISGISMNECVELSKQLGKRVGKELKIPVYLYAYAATKPERTRLPDIRAGEYEALPEKIKTADFTPDFGPAVFNKKSGATAIGARDFLIAYNINLNTRNKSLATKIAKRVREKGFIKTNPQSGEKETIPGILPGVQGVGWYIENYGMAQCSYNIMDYKVSPVHRVFEETDKIAAEFGVRVTGSELVGLIPLQALLEAGNYFLGKQNSSLGVNEREILHTAVQSLGLAEIADFNIDERIIEYKLKKPGKLANMSLYQFADELASDSPAPGGGSVAALNGMLSAGLTAMVGNLTFGKKGYEEVKSEIEQTAIQAQTLKKFFADAIDADTDAFNKIMAAFSLPKSNEAEITIRKQAVLAATKDATLVPLSVLEKTLEAAKLALVAASKGNKNSLSDAGVAGLTAAAAAEGALYNVMINLQGIDDPAFFKNISHKALNLYQQVQLIITEIRNIMISQLQIKKLQ